MTQTIYPFFADGRADALAEVRILQHQGLWTCEMRASWLKEAVAISQRLYHTHPSLAQGRSYYAGRIAVLKSRQTARYPKLNPSGKAVFLSITPDLVTICADCGESATWEWYPNGNLHLLTYLCDRCKQEQVRAETVYTTPNGWDWDDDEEEQSDQLLPVALSSSERREIFLALSQRVLPLAFFLGFDVSNLFYPVSQSTMFDELFTVVLVALLCKPLLRLCLRALLEGEGE